MRIATFEDHDGRRLGVVADNAILDLARHAPELPGDMVGFLGAGEAALARARAVLEQGGPSLPIEGVRLHAPVPRPGKYLAVGLNYADHVEESGIETPRHPTFFTKQATCVTGPFDAVHLPRVSDALDYEGELAFVIGRRCRHVPRERAPEVIAGFCVADDVSVRDWQLRVAQFTLGKSFDTHGPLGPWLVTPDEVGDPHSLELVTTVNGEERQRSNTRHLIFDCYEMVAQLTAALTLEPGDVIATGTPAGVGGMSQPPRFLKAGDVVRVEIEGIGAIENRVVPEPDDTTFLDYY